MRCSVRWLCVGLLLVPALVPAGCRSGEGLKRGDVVRLQAAGKDDDVPLAIMPNKLIAYLAADKQRRKEMEAAGDVFLVKAGARARVAYAYSTTVKVDVQDGPHKGFAGWCPLSQLKR